MCRQLLPLTQRPAKTGRTHTHTLVLTHARTHAHLCACALVLMRTRPLVHKHALAHMHTRVRTHRLHTTSIDDLLSRTQAALVLARMCEGAWVALPVPTGVLARAHMCEGANMWACLYTWRAHAYV